MRNFVVIVLLFVFSATLIAQTTDTKPGKPLRPVKGRTLTSAELPSVRLKFGKDFKYAGGQRFELYGVATAEQHFFIDAGKDGLIRRMYWVQFEGYLPTNKNFYNYKGARSVDIGGLSFIADTYARNIRANPGRPDSDAAIGRNYLARHGYRLASDETLSQRFLHFIGDDKRNELMIIYLEDLSALGVTAADLADGGKAAAKRAEIFDAVLARSTRDVTILR
jgi:hypothetical protein